MNTPGHLISELKRRRVFRVAAVYAAVGFVIWQAADIAFPALQLPDWLVTAVVALTILGFPIALVLAWAFEVTPEGVIRTDPSPVERPAAPIDPGATRNRRRFVLPVAVTAVLLATSGTGWFLMGGEQTVPRGDALLTAVTELTAAERFSEAFDLASRATAAGETVPDSLWMEVADYLTVTSDPSGAMVGALRIEADADATDGEWIELGMTPLRGLPMARGEYLLRLELDGHATAERIASSQFGRARNSRATNRGEVALSVTLIPDSLLPGDVVRVHGGVYSIVSRDLQGHSASLEDYFLDRFEVSNAAFAEFVDAGGYRRGEYWTDLSEALGAEAVAARQGFTDRTGLHGPRSWSGQRPPPAERTLPVTGVSWYEAAAYCRFQGGRLPTVYEWEKAARDGRIAYGEGVFMPWGLLGPRGTGVNRANFSSEGPVSVDAHLFGISPWGAYGMAGNVKEWLANPTETGRAVAGGSWADPIYVFSEVGSLDPMHSSETVGIRCARHVDPARSVRGDQGAGPLRVSIRTPEYWPADDATFPLLLAHYAYDGRSMNAEVSERLHAPGWTRERILYDGPENARVIAYLYLPDGGRPPYQTLVYVPSTASFFGTPVTESAEWLLGPLVRAGRALFVVAMEGMTEREWPAGFERPAPSSVAFRDLMVRHATELRMGLDYLEERDDVDMDALAYVGLSWGAGSRLLFAALDERFSAVAFIGGGIDERVHPTLPEASNINFAPRIRAPTLLLNGDQDEEHPWLTRALPLWNLLSEPKELVLVEGVGHVPPLESRIPAMRDWLDRHFGPVRQ